MPRDLFGDVSDPSVRVTTRSRYTVPVSFTVHAVVIAAVLAIPILAPAALPALHERDIVYAEVAPPPLPPPPPVVRAVEPPAPVVNPSAAPVTAPDSIRPETGRELEMTLPPSAEVGIVGVTGRIDTVVTAPPPPPPASRTAAYWRRRAAAVQDQGCRAGVSRYRTGRPRGGHGDYRCGDRRAGPRAVRARAAVDSAPRRSCADRRARVGVHTDAAQWCPGAGGDDGDGDFPVEMKPTAETRSARSSRRRTRRVSSMILFVRPSCLRALRVDRSIQYVDVTVPRRPRSSPTAGRAGRSGRSWSSCGRSAGACRARR